MKINFGLTGKERKTLVEAISQELNTTAKYLGTPRYDYQIGEFNVSRDGVLTGADNRGLVTALSGTHGFKAVSEEYDGEELQAAAETNTENTTALKAVMKTETETATASDAETKTTADTETDPDTTTALDAEAKTTTGLEADEVPAYEDMQLSEREEQGLGKERRDPIGENGMQACDIPESFTYRAELHDPNSPDRMEVFSADNDEDAIRQAYEFTDGEVVLLELYELDEDYNELRWVDVPPNPNRLTIKRPLDGFTPDKLEILNKMVTAKTPLLKAALGATKLPVIKTNDSLLFPWFSGTIDEAHTEAYSMLIGLLCKTALEKTRSTAKEKDVPENPKYAMRVFLLSLGFIGSDFKSARKILLSRLEGSGAYKGGEHKSNTGAHETSESSACPAAFENGEENLE